MAAIIPVEWILVVLLLSPGGESTAFDVDVRYRSYTVCQEARDELERIWDRASYIDSWCRPVDSTDTMIV